MILESIHIKVKKLMHYELILKLIQGVLFNKNWKDFQNFQHFQTTINPYMLRFRFKSLSLISEEERYL